MLFNNPTLIAVRNAISHYTSFTFNHYRHTELIWCVVVTVLFMFTLIDNATVLLPAFIVALLTLQCWHFIFERKLKYILPSVYTITYAMLFSLLLPMGISSWPLVLCVSFGSVFGERVFGGRGFAFLNPVTLGLAFYLFSNPIELSSTGASFIPSVLIATTAFMLAVMELVAWRTLLGIAVGVVTTAWLINLQALQLMVSSSVVLLALIVLGGDPGSGGSTNLSRWLHGLLCGCLLVFLYSQTTAAIHATIFAVLLASLSAPLLDYLVVLIHTTRRKRRYE